MRFRHSESTIMKITLSALAVVAALAAAIPARAEDARGQWSGTIANTVTVILKVEQGAGGAWEATLSSPSQGFATKVEKFETSADRLSFAIPKLNASYQASWDAQAQAWSGTWSQGQKAPLALKRISAQDAAAAQPRRPQESAIAAGAAAAPYVSQEVKFDSSAAGVKLAGSLSVPKGAGPFPAVVLVHGSGPNNRDEDVFNHKIFLVLADHLARQGIAVLRYDKRGIAQSTGDYKAATTFDFADDAQAAVAFLRSRADIDARHIGMIGHSEGGLIAPMVAARDPQLGFVVMLAGPGVRGELLMIEQMALASRAGGASEADLARERVLNSALFAAIAGEKDLAQAHVKAKAILDQAEKDGVLPPGMGALQLKSFTSPWFHSFLALEPGPALRAMRQPVLVLNGELDRQVPSRLDLDAIRAALAGNPRAVVKELPKLNHLFQTAATGAGSEYGKIEETVAPAALAEVSSWIRAQVGGQHN